MNESTIFEQLAIYAPWAGEENEALEYIVSLTHLKSEIFTRTCLPGHFTGSSWIVTPDGSSVLLLYHRKLRKWLQPGGHADGDPDLTAVAIREAREETGLSKLKLYSHNIFDVDRHLIPPSVDLQSHYHLDIRYLIVAEAGVALTESKESSGLCWVGLGELEKLGCDSGMIRMREKVLRLTAAHGKLAVPKVGVE